MEIEFPEFRDWWQNHDVLDKPHARKEFCHPQAGLLIFDSVTLFAEEATDFKIFVTLRINHLTRKKNYKSCSCPKC